MEVALPLQIASGILIAALVMFMARSALVWWGKGDATMALFLLVPASLIGGILIFAGLGLVAW
ncbi:MAG: hypothetical protein ACU0CT_03550 [Paracoccaceae bacterium]